MRSHDTLDCPEFREGVIEAVVRTYKFKPARPKTQRVIRPLFRILADESERTPDQHYPLISSAIGDSPQTPDREPTLADFQMVNNLIAYAKIRQKRRGNKNAIRKGNKI